MSKPSTLNVYTLLGLACFTAIVVWNAWVAEDAYICLRTVDNCVNGLGLTWNPTERVQSFTCPLWVLLLIPIYAITHEAFLTILAVSVVLSVSTASVLIFGIARKTPHALFILLILSLSRASVDYATSGLENALGHLLLAVFGLLFFRGFDSGPAIFWLSLVAWLGVVNRMDHALLYAPALAYAIFRPFQWSKIAYFSLGMAPFLAWEIFATFYFGFPFPNTAYAKLGTLIPLDQLLLQGLRYFANSLEMDPLTLVTIVAALVAALLSREYRQVFLAMGVLLYFVYILRVGGDFMSGRFFSSPLILALALLANLPENLGRFPWLLTYVLIGILAYLSVQLPPLTGFHRRGGYESEQLISRGGIADEADFYRSSSGLFRKDPQGSWRFCTEPTHIWVQQGLQARDHAPCLALKQNVGFFGFYAGPEVETVDPLALTDPLLARLPAVEDKDWRIGHFHRLIPEGYLKTVATGTNHLNDPKLAEYYQHLQKITRGPLWDGERLLEIWRFNTGQYEHLVDRNRYHKGIPALRKLSSLPAKPQGAVEDHLFLTPQGLPIDLEGRRHALRLEIGLGDGCTMLVSFLDGAEIFADIEVEARQFTGWGQVQTHTLEVPTEIRARGYTGLLIRPKFRMGEACFGHLSLLD